MLRRGVIRVATIAAIVASCAENSVVQPPPRPPISLAPPCVSCAVPKPPAAESELSVGPATVKAVDPTQGTTAGGDKICVFGENFVPGKTLAEIKFGRKMSPLVTIATTKTIHVVTPPGDKGPVDITIYFDDGQEFVIPNGFRYVAPTEGDDVRPSNCP